MSLCSYVSMAIGQCNVYYQAILRAGVRRARLVLGIDLTASNEWQGRRTFSGNCLHKIHAVRPSQIVNPYQKVINIIGKTLQPFTEEGMGEIIMVHVVHIEIIFHQY